MITVKKHISNEFGNLLKEKMEEKKISMTGLGKIVGVHRTTISDYILGKHLPKEETFHRIHQVFPDKDLYDAYFRAVEATEPRKNKQLIPEAAPYNYYKAETENIKAAEHICKQLVEAKAIKDAATSDDTYIAIALTHMVSLFEQTNMSIYAPTDYSAYKRLKEQYQNK